MCDRSRFAAEAARDAAIRRHVRSQNRIVTGSNEALGCDLTVEPSFDAGLSGDEVFVVLSDEGRRICPMLNQPPLTASICSKLSSWFRLVIVSLPELIWKVSRELNRSRSGTQSTVTRITKKQEAGGAPSKNPQGNKSCRLGP